VVAWHIYLLQCADGTVYTGIATDVRRRIAEHESGSRGAKYLRGRGPFTLLYVRELGDRSLATQLELRVKKLPRGDKVNTEALPDLVDRLLADLLAQRSNDDQ
jgi:putative endonuclease